MINLNLKSPRTGALLLAAFCVPVSLGMGALVIGDMIDLAHDVQNRKALIETEHHTSMVLILLPFLLCLGLLALVGLFSKPMAPATSKLRKTAEQRRKEDRQSRWAQWYLLYVFVSILLALFSPIPQFFILNHLLSERGYVFCPAPLLARNPPDTWALPGPHGAKEHCPREGAGTSS